MENDFWGVLFGLLSGGGGGWERDDDGIIVEEKDIGLKPR